MSREKTWVTTMFRLSMIVKFPRFNTHVEKVQVSWVFISLIKCLRMIHLYLDNETHVFLPQLLLRFCLYPNVIPCQC